MQIKFIFLTPLLISYVLNSIVCSQEEMHRKSFPDGFLFGAATSSYQIEGAVLEDGKGLNNWDVFAHIPGVIQVCWRLLGGRFGDVNIKGIAFYNNLIDNLLKEGIEPFVTLHHFDTPQELDDRYGSWLSPLIQDDFADFAETCFRSFGDRVKYWVTFNEPNHFTDFAYKKGLFAPGRCSAPFGNCSQGNSEVEPLIVMHNIVLSHAKATKIYRDHYQPKQGGSIGAVLNAFMYEPFHDIEADREAVSRRLAFDIAWFLDPVIHGDYPVEMRHFLGSQLPEFSSEESEQMKLYSLDFIGVNHYSTLYVKDCICSHCDSGGHAIEGFVFTTGERDGVPIGEPTSIPVFFVVPTGMEKIIEYLKTRYDNLPIFVTENGFSQLDHQPIKESDELLQDHKRIEYHKGYLASLAKAINDGADVRGYFVWSLIDNFEWHLGFSFRFGLYYVDYNTLERTPKMSASWFRDFLTNATLIDESDGLGKTHLERKTYSDKELCNV